MTPTPGCAQRVLECPGVSWRVPCASPGVNHRAPDVNASGEGRKPPPQAAGREGGGGQRDSPNTAPPPGPHLGQGTLDWEGTP